MKFAIFAYKIVRNKFIVNNKFISKIINYFYYKNRAFRRLLWFFLESNYPSYVLIETQSVCNRKCGYCPVAYHPREKKKMSFSMYKKVIHELQEINYSGILGLYLYNEPLIDKRLEDFSKYAKECLPLCKINIVTNGDLLTKDRAISLYDSGVDLIEISQHDKTMKQALQDSISYLQDSEYKDRIIVKNFSDATQNTSDVNFNNRGGLVEVQKRKKENLKYNGCIYGLYLTISHTGNYVYCCNDYNEKYLHGNIENTTLKHVWEQTKPERKKIFNGHYTNKMCLTCAERD